MSFVTSSLGASSRPERPLLDLQAGYILRSLDVLPKAGTRRPWLMGHNFLRDVVDERMRPIEDSMVFGRAPADQQQPA